LIEVHNSAARSQVDEAVLFPFDQHSFPFTFGLRLHMEGDSHTPHPIVVLPGPSGAPDDARTRFYGTVIPMGDELRMWYLGSGHLDGDFFCRICYATSRDGVHWERPNLGLVSYNGNRDNNLIDLPGIEGSIASFAVLHDPTEADPQRRFKMTIQCKYYRGRLSVAYSPDGLRWTQSPNNPCGVNIEMSGLIRHKGCYYVNGHGSFQYGMKRNLITYASYDFENWTFASCLGFRRDRIPHRTIAQIDDAGNSGEQVHLGAGLWDRGTVILAAYDIWHGHPSGDRTLLTMDIGLLISHDALHFEEPIPDFKLVRAIEPAGGEGASKPEEGLPPLRRGPALSRGQGMCNWGEETLFWYEGWVDGGIRLARWPQDRLGFMRAFNPRELGWQGGPAYWHETARHLITCPISLGATDAQVFLNVGGLSEHSTVTVEVQNEKFQPLPGYEVQDCAALRESGLRVPVRWKGRDGVRVGDGPIRLRVNFGGIRPEDAQLYAIYIVSK